MKKFLCSLLALGLLTAQAQDNNDYKKGATLIVNLTAFDFTTAQSIRNSSVGAVLRNKQWTKPQNMGIGFGLSYLKGLTNYIDLATSLNGAFVDYPFREKASYNNARLLLEGDVMANVKLLTDKHVVVPYFSAGVGASKAASVWGAYIPVGVGIQVKMLEETFFMTNAQYRIPVTQEANYHFMFSAGFGTSIGEKKEVAAKPLPVMPQVVTPPVVEKVVVKDTDNDGIPDDQDKCPTVAGTAKYFGCPIPDTDRDGINDEEDKCPNVPGVARLSGCPVPDTDGDGLNDEQDKCPTEAGPASNGGCPVKEIPKVVITEEVKAAVNTAATRIYFQTGKSTLLSTSYPALKSVIGILNENESVQLDVEGYTDNTGGAKANQVLSQNRANAVMNYIVKNGISKDRLTAKGFGISNPIATNKTAAGRAKNRRVVMKIIE